MYQVVKQLKSSFAIFSAVFITVISTSRVRAQHTCDSHAYLQCSKPLSVLDSGLTFGSTKADLDRTCLDLKEALRCVHSYTRRCMSLEHRRHFKKLLHGTALVVHELCRNGTYQEEYLRLAPCMKETANEYNNCLVAYTDSMKEIQAKSIEINVSESDTIVYQKRKRETADEGVKHICCAFQKYIGCSTETMRYACGNDAAEFSRNFLDKMSSSLLQLHCTEYNEVCPASSAPQMTLSITATMMMAVLLFIIYYLR